MESRNIIDVKFPEDVLRDSIRRILINKFPEFKNIRLHNTSTPDGENSTCAVCN